MNKEADLLRVHPSAGYSITIQLKIKNSPGNLGIITQKVAETGASLGEISLLHSDFYFTLIEITFNCTNEEHAKKIIEIIKTIDQVELLTWRDDTFTIHDGGKLNVLPRQRLTTVDELSRTYTPGVGRVCVDITKNPDHIYRYTIKNHTIAIVTDGSAVLGLGNIGPEASLPVMEGKLFPFALLLKTARKL